MHLKSIKSHTKNMKLKYQFRRAIKNLSYLKDHILYQKSKTCCIIKKNEALCDNPSMRIHINKRENILTFEIKTRYYLEL